MNGEDIFKILKDFKKEYLIFNQDVESALDLKLVCNYLTNNSCSIKDRTKPITVNFLYDIEKENSLNAVEKKITNFGYGDVTYTINELGFRMTTPIEKIRNGIGIFGCSYTFGVGVPNDLIFPSLLQNDLTDNVCNFGIPGGGVQKITKAFMALNNFYHLKKAVFILPSLYRHEFIRYKNERMEVIDLLHNFKDDNYLVNCIYDHFDDMTFMNEYYKNLNLIKNNAKINGTEIIFLTWCGQTLELDRSLNINYIQDKINFIENDEIFNNKIVTDLARDGMHPGIRTHKETYDKIIKILKNV